MAATKTWEQGKAGRGSFSRRNFAPVLFLNVLGRPADDLLAMCTRFSFERSTDKAAECKMVFRNDSRNLLDDPRFLLNQRWEIRFGYFNDLSPILHLIVREVSPVYEAKRTVNVTLYDHALDLATSSGARNWGRITSSEIAAKIAANHDMQVVTDPSNDRPQKAFVQPQSVNDLQYLRDLAADIDFEVFVSGNPSTLYFRKRPDNAPAVRLLTYYDDPSEFSYVVKFAPKTKSLGPVKSGAAAADPKGGGKEAAQTNKGAVGSSSLGPEYRIVWNSLTGESYAVRNDPPPAKETKGTADPAPTGANTNALAKVLQQQQLDKAVEATSEHPLSPSLRAGFVYSFAGLDRQLNGPWYCQKEAHEITGTSSKTTMTLKRGAKAGKGNSTDADGGAGADKKGANKGTAGTPTVVRITVGGDSFVIPGSDH